MIITVAEMMYLALFDESFGKDKLQTKIYVMAVSALIVVSEKSRKIETIKYECLI